ncbi:glycoside hydrolase family 97 catalytic domain-containing protein [Bacteroides ovatus]|nr:glycoside hydrolase family 97 catalytic domain-containing protein [Bacteroides ovatus]
MERKLPLISMDLPTFRFTEEISQRDDFEGVLGLEHDKDSRDINPVHDLILPFTRMVAGPMDYTPVQ